jgi:hypothetical protein
MRFPPWSAIRWLVQDTFHQARASGVCWLTWGVTVACAVGCLTITLREGGGGEPSAETRVELAAGSIAFHVPGGTVDAVREVQVRLGGWVAGAAGMLLAMLWTAGLLPAFLQPAAAAVLLAKPVPRWGLLAGRCLGVPAFVGVQALIFLGATWLALALRTGVWDVRYFLCLPLLLLHFAVFFSFSVLLAVATRSTVASILGTIAFWALCAAVNLARHALHVVPDLADLGAGAGRGAEVGYWFLPKPLDLHALLLNWLQEPGRAGGALDLPSLVDRGLWSPPLSVLTSVAYALVLFAMAACDFRTAEY